MPPHTLCDFHPLRPGCWRDQHGCELYERTSDGHITVALYSKFHYDAYLYQASMVQCLADAHAQMTAFWQR